MSDLLCSHFIQQCWDIFFCPVTWLGFQKAINMDVSTVYSATANSAPLPSNNGWSNRMQFKIPHVFCVLLIDWGNHQVNCTFQIWQLPCYNVILVSILYARSPDEVSRGPRATVAPADPSSLECPTCLFIQTEYCKAQTLYHWLRENRPRKTVANYFEQVSVHVCWAHCYVECCLPRLTSGWWWPYNVIYAPNLVPRPCPAFCRY